MAGPSDRAVRAPLRIALTVMLIQQFSGINAVIFFSGSILGSAGMANRDLGGAIIMAIQVCVTGVACLLVDRLGRRALLIGSLAGMVGAAALMGLCYALGDAMPPVVSLVALVLYIASFALGLGPVPWLLMAEILPAKARGVASSAATLLNWTCAFIITESFDTVQAAISPAGTFFLFSAICLAGIAYVSKQLPETNGATLAEIEALFVDRGA